MTKRTVFTTISPLPPGVSREVVLEFLLNHVDMIDLNPLVIERHPIEAPPDADPYEKDCSWYSLTDKIDYIRGAKVSGNISYTCAFHDLPNGIQTHCRAPLGVDIRDKWTLHGTLADEPPEPVELGLGAPASGLYIREDVDLRCNILMASFVKKNLRRSHAALVNKLVEKARLSSAEVSTASPETSSYMWSAPSYMPHGSFHPYNSQPVTDEEEVSPLTQGDTSPALDDEPTRRHSVRLIAPYQLMRPQTPPPASDSSQSRPRSHSQLQSRSPDNTYQRCPPILRVPVPRPTPPERTAPAVPTRTAPAPPNSGASIHAPTRAAPPPPSRDAPPPPPPLPPKTPPYPDETTPPPSPPYPSSPSREAALPMNPPRLRSFPRHLHIHNRPVTEIIPHPQHQLHQPHQQEEAKEENSQVAWWTQLQEQHSPASSRPSTPDLAPAPLSINTSNTSTPALTLRSASHGSFSTSTSNEFEHPDYPHLSPYSLDSNYTLSDDGEANDGVSRLPRGEGKPPPPRTTPAFMWKGFDFESAPGEEEQQLQQHPACLRPGGQRGRGLSCRLDGPFIAELEC